MKLISWNVNGLRSILGKGFGDYLRAEDADVVCLQEIKAAPDQVELPLAPGWRVWWNAAQRKGYSGTLTLARIAPGTVTAGIGEPEGDAEGRVQTLEFAGFYLVNVYTPNARGDLSRLDFRTRVWDPAFRAHCQRLEARKPVIFCGDLNVAHREIDLANPRANRGSAGFTDAERAQFDLHLQAGYLDSFRVFDPAPARYSWWSYRAGARARNVGWRIDYFGVSARLRERLRAAFIRPEVMGSDHAPVGIELDL
jgi:exodeoxyribonuclease-3